jgi:hypothetical protein
MPPCRSRRGACYHLSVSARVAALIGAAIAVLGALVYLYVAVNAAPTLPSGAPAAPVAAPATSDSTDDRAARATEEPMRPRPDVRDVAPEPEMPSEPRPIAADLATDPKLELSTAMDQANRYYDRQEHDAAQEAALRVLEKEPGNVRMLRIVVSTACMMGEPDKAQRYWTELPERDRTQMSSRCGRFGIAFKE